MENREKKRLLNSYRHLVRQEKILKDALIYNREMYLAGSPKYDGMPHGSTQKDLSEYVVKAESLSDELQMVMAEKHEKLREINRALDEMTNDKERTLLMMVYIGGYSWAKVAKEMAIIDRRDHPYSYRHVTRLHGSALAHFNPGVKE